MLRGYYTKIGQKSTGRGGIPKIDGLHRLGAHPSLETLFGQADLNPFARSLQPRHALAFGNQESHTLGGAQAARPEAVVVAARVEARTGPSAAERVGFLVPEGQRVAWLEASGDWVQIGLPEKGLKGWVRADAVAPVEFPEAPPAG
jgi:hypothetical protein